jgi:hypothetical protein
LHIGFLPFTGLDFDGFTVGKVTGDEDRFAGVASVESERMAGTGLSRTGP